MVEDFARARAALADRATDSGGIWSNFRKETPDLPEMLWPIVWEKVFEEISQERAQEERAEREAARRRGFIVPAVLGPEFFRPSPGVADLARGATASYEWQRRDELAANYGRAQQRVEDCQDELRRLQEAHAEIIRPDVRLWIGVAVVVIFAAVGVALPMGVMSQGPTDLARVHWLLWPFAAALVILVVYVVAYLASISRRKPPPIDVTTGDAAPAPPEAKSAEPGEPQAT